MRKQILAGLVLTILVVYAVATYLFFRNGNSQNAAIPTVASLLDMQPTDALATSVTLIEATVPATIVLSTSSATALPTDIALVGTATLSPTPQPTKTETPLPAPTTTLVALPNEAMTPENDDIADCQPPTPTDPKHSLVMTSRRHAVSNPLFRQQVLFEAIREVFQIEQSRALIDVHAARFGVNPQNLYFRDQNVYQWQRNLSEPLELAQLVFPEVKEELAMWDYWHEGHVVITNADIERERQTFYNYAAAARAEAMVVYEAGLQRFPVLLGEYGLDESALQDYLCRQALRHNIQPVVLATIDSWLYADVSIIMVERREQADEILELLADGADFAQLAIGRSIDFGSGQRGGALGWERVYGLLNPLARAIEKAEIGVVFGPIEAIGGTSDGFFIGIVHDREVREIPAEELEALRQADYSSWLRERQIIAGVTEVTESEWWNAVKELPPVPTFE